LSFSDTLARMTARIEGGAAAIILGVDGIPIERYVATDQDRDIDFEMVATELTTLLRRSMKTASDTALGQLHEMVLATERMTFLLRPITSEYFLLLAILPGGNVGRGRFELRKAQISLMDEFVL
jgi:predicted regulator of Ras-like GTPase activity (Roadblock/LC7/MglB family)